MAKTITQSFEEYKSNLEIKDRQVSLVRQRRENVVTALRNKLSLNDERSKLIGSWDRHTLTRYLSEGDVDVMVILHYSDNKHWDDNAGATKALDRFKDILDDAYPSTPKRRDRNAIVMQFSEFRLDVVPAFKRSESIGGYKIPDSIRKQWIITDPIRFASAVTHRNTMMDLKFVPLIKMVKGWNRKAGWPIRSFHLECLLLTHCQGLIKGYTYPSMLVLFFDALPGYLAASCYDPITGDRVDTYLDNGASKTKRQIAIEKARSAAADAREAYDDQDKFSAVPEIPIREWKMLLGEFFPAYG